MKKCSIMFKSMKNRFFVETSMFLMKLKAYYSRNRRLKYYYVKGKEKPEKKPKGI